MLGREHDSLTQGASVVEVLVRLSVAVLLGGGIGFLGAGAIIQNRGQVSGITTAASVWVAGALGAAAGVGAYVLAFATAAFAFTILALVGRSGRDSAADARAAEQTAASNDRAVEQAVRSVK